LLNNNEKCYSSILQKISPSKHSLSLVWAGYLAFLAQLGGNKGGRIPEVTFQWAGGRGAAGT